VGGTGGLGDTRGVDDKSLSLGLQVLRILLQQTLTMSKTMSVYCWFVIQDKFMIEEGISESCHQETDRLKGFCAIRLFRPQGSDHPLVRAPPVCGTLMHHYKFMLGMHITSAIQYVKFRGVQKHARPFVMPFIFSTFYTRAYAPCARGLRYTRYTYTRMLKTSVRSFRQNECLPDMFSHITMLTTSYPYTKPPG
jgi:hypothetical protein